MLNGSLSDATPEAPQILTCFRFVCIILLYTRKWISFQITSREPSLTTEYVSPKGIGASKASVEAFAEKVAVNVGFKIGGNIEDLIERAGGKFVMGSSGQGDTDSGSIIARSTNDFTIFISRHTSLKRDRFTIAHELGHLLLHLGPIQKKDPSAVMRATRWVDKSDESQRRAEWEANWFAAAFLMPKAEFIEAYKAVGIQRVQFDFDVSEMAAQTRAKSLVF